MLDQIGAIFTTAYYVILASVLVARPRIGAATALAVVAAALAWLASVAGTSALGWMATGALGPMPGPVLFVVGLLMLLLGSWALVPRFREAIMSLPLPVLVALHAGRIGGVFFLLLYAAGRLSSPFASAAGLGDMITGAVALGLAGLLALGVEVRRVWLLLWNAFGMLDLVTAVSLAALSTEGTPYRVFTEGPGTQAMTSLPWILIPSAIVPILFLLHVAIAAKVRGYPEATHAAAMAG